MGPYCSYRSANSFLNRSKYWCSGVIIFLFLNSGLLIMILTEIRQKGSKLLTYLIFYLTSTQCQCWDRRKEWVFQLSTDAIIRDSSLQIQFILNAQACRWTYHDSSVQVQFLSYFISKIPYISSRNSDLILGQLMYSEIKLINMYIIIYIILTDTMLSERRKFTYMSGNYSTKNEKENNHLQRKKIKELQEQNKNIIEDTTNQFKQFESDLLHVEEIIVNKQSTIKQLQTERQKGRQQKYILIEALKEKDLIINQLQKKLKEMLYTENGFNTSRSQELHPINQHSESDPSEQPCSNSNVIEQECQTKENVEMYESGIQTQQLKQQYQQEDKIEYKGKYEQVLEKAVKLQDQVYRLKEELFSSNSELNLVRQEFSTYKLLKQIEDVQNQ